MNYFNLTENISTIDRILRILVGMTLLLATFADVTLDVHPSVFPMIAAYLVLTAIMKWDPVGYVVEVVLRVLGWAEPSIVPAASKSTLRTSM